MNLLDTLVAVERTLWKNDIAAYERTLTDDATLVFVETGPISKATAIDEIRKENERGRRWGDVRFDDTQVTPVSDDVAALTYKATAHWQNEDAGMTALCTSVYVRRSDGWKLALHQQSNYPEAK
jgi:ketosteroid isomerase-like protein